MTHDITQCLEAEEKIKRLEAENRELRQQVASKSRVLVSIEALAKELAEVLRELIIDINSEFYEHEKIHKFSSLTEAKAALKKWEATRL